MTTRLYHYTCDHGHDGITHDGFVKPHMQVVLGGLELTWFTDLDVPDRNALGLTSTILTCDRIKYRFEADVAAGLRWWPQAVRDLDLHRYRRSLELAPGAAPMHWYVSLGTVPVAVRATREAATR